ncbi:MAG: response regulator transcription factor [Parvularculaceae bacterium]|nr:response regulator transcription factor [Parvularculaceae bacterium]
MRKTILLYGAVIALAAIALEWLEYQYFTRVFATEFYIFLLALGFTVLGVWVGRRLTERQEPGRFEKNVAALAALGVTDREYDVLTLLAEGGTNKEIARRLDVSPNTVKTHTARLYEKLDVGRRTQAVQKARELRLIP